MWSRPLGPQMQELDALKRHTPADAQAERPDRATEASHPSGRPKQNASR